jgi:enterochelin esterase-like enzyme
MNFINPPEKLPESITHKTFYSRLYNHELGYNIYLPDGYEKSGERYPAAYHLHGWTGNESSEIWQMEKVYKNKPEITVFPNSSPVIEDLENLPVESMITSELIPYIDSHYRTNATCGGRSVSGFSMGGGMAFWCAVKYPGLFSSVTAYAPTFHHYLHKEDTDIVGKPIAEAPERYSAMMEKQRHLKEGNIIHLIHRNADIIRKSLKIKIHVGEQDVLICENEIIHLHLKSLEIPHEYKIFGGAAHELSKIL